MHWGVYYGLFICAYFDRYGIGGYSATFPKDFSFVCVPCHLFWPTPTPAANPATDSSWLAGRAGLRGGDPTGAELGMVEVCKFFFFFCYGLVCFFFFFNVFCSLGLFVCCLLYRVLF